MLVVYIRTLKPLVQCHMAHGGPSRGVSQAPWLQDLLRCLLETSPLVQPPWLPTSPGPARGRADRLDGEDFVLENSSSTLPLELEDPP